MCSRGLGSDQVLSYFPEVESTKIHKSQRIADLSLLEAESYVPDVIIGFNPTEYAKLFKIPCKRY